MYYVTTGMSHKWAMQMGPTYYTWRMYPRHWLKNRQCKLCLFGTEIWKQFFVFKNRKEKKKWGPPI